MPAATSGDYRSNTTGLCIITCTFRISKKLFVHVCCGWAWQHQLCWLGVVGKDDIQQTILQFIAAMIGFGQLCCVFPWGGLTWGDLEMNEQCQNQQKTGFNFQQVSKRNTQYQYSFLWLIASTTSILRRPPYPEGLSGATSPAWCRLHWCLNKVG
jgi:hypothetical protein